MNLIEIWITCPSTEVAEDIANDLLANHLVACANVFGKVRSLYRWQGKIEHETEVPLAVKTREALFDTIADRVAAAHPYETPAIIAVPIVRTNRAYEDWLIDSTEQRRGAG